MAGQMEGFSYRTHATRDDAIKGQSLGNPMGHTAAARMDGVMNRPLLGLARDGGCGRGTRDALRATVGQRVDHVGKMTRWCHQQGGRCEAVVRRQEISQNVATRM